MRPPRLAILSPYAEQVRRLATMVSTEFPGSSQSLFGFRPAIPGYCGTVDAFQGNEAEVVVVSLVRNNDHYGPLAALGFLSDARRMNVLLSRAKWQMILVGGMEFLQTVVDAAATPEHKEIVSPLGKVLSWLTHTPAEHRPFVQRVAFGRLQGDLR
jgi:superfamily I DNA and/or RNA helicase